MVWEIHKMADQWVGIQAMEVWCSFNLHNKTLEAINKIILDTIKEDNHHQISLETDKCLTWDKIHLDMIWIQLHRQMEVVEWHILPIRIQRDLEVDTRIRSKLLQIKQIMEEDMKILEWIHIQMVYKVKTV